MKLQRSFYLLMMTLILFSCSNNKKLSDAYGNFEADETIISAEVNGRLLEFAIEEGQSIDSGKIIAVIDTMQLHFTLIQLLSQKQAINAKFPGISGQLNVLKQQKENLLKDKERIDKMFAGKAATQKQLDDINGALNVIDKQLSQIETQNAPVSAELNSLSAQIEKTRDMINKSIVTNQLNGTVLSKLAEKFELVFPGKPLYKIANLNKIILRAYISGSQLSQVKIGQKVRVLLDNGTKDTLMRYGVVSWISAQAEFTPKIIQTKEERVNMVYAIKVIVPNDGTMKIGMPGELIFESRE